MDIGSLLYRVELFQTLNEDSLKALQAVAHLVNFETGSFIVQENEAGDSLFIVVSGLLEVLKTSVDGQCSKVAVLAPGHIFGEMSLLTGSPRNATITAQTPVTLIEVNKSHFEPILRLNPELANRITEIQLKREEANEAALKAAGKVLNESNKISGDSLREKIRRFFQLN
ncbi:MAG: cyclic nucleotide-binding domain-containing protein [Syntrophales bacterium LBB04]|nr:cyclic nucleotide-binding domain-containing protein [Syntrophales bacterium LBB04]